VAPGADVDRRVLGGEPGVISLVGSGIGAESVTDLGEVRHGGDSRQRQRNLARIRMVTVPAPGGLMAVSPTIRVSSTGAAPDWT